jgi:hypothetical protein
MMLDDASHQVQCPWCFESMEIWVDPMSRGRMSRDCEVCCRPWSVFVERSAADPDAATHVHVERES